MSTEKQIIANRENAQRSTGPRTEEGKTKSSMNAIKTGLTGRTVFLPGDDVAVYEKHLTGLEDLHKPETDAEKLLVQSIADTDWRLARIPSLEAGIYALGRQELQDQFTNEEEPVRRLLMDARVFLTYGRQLNNLSIQENRLRRQREKDLAALTQSQATRRHPEEVVSGNLAARAIKAAHPDRPVNQSAGAKPSGFEFPARRTFQELTAKWRLDHPSAYPFGEPRRSTPAETCTQDDLATPDAA